MSNEEIRNKETLKSEKNIEVEKVKKLLANKQKKNK